MIRNIPHNFIKGLDIWNTMFDGFFGNATAATTICFMDDIKDFR